MLAMCYTVPKVTYQSVPQLLAWDHLGKLCFEGIKLVLQCLVLFSEAVCVGECIVELGLRMHAHV